MNHQNNTQDSIPKVIVIFPAKNEEDTIEHSIAAAKQSYYKPDVILVDAYSTDKTTHLAERAGATVIQQPTKIFPAKGLAMKAGLRKAFDRSADIILFLDADIRNLTLEWVDQLVKALIDDNCDMSRGFYTRHVVVVLIAALAIILIIGSSFPNALSISSLKNKEQSAYTSSVGLIVVVMHQLQMVFITSIPHQPVPLYSTPKFISKTGSKSTFDNILADRSNKVVMINFDDGHESADIC